MTGILFDLDETLIDRTSAVNQFCESLWRVQNIERQMTLEAFKVRVIDLDRVGYTPRSNFFEQMWVEFGHHFSSRQDIESAFYQSVWETPTLFDGVLESLSVLRANHVPMGLVTNGSVKAQSEKIKHSGIGPFFDVVVVSEAIGLKKPHPRLFQEGLSNLGVDADDCWFVGDHPLNDIWGSKQLGMKTAWVHHNRPWSADVEPCFDIQAEGLNDVMSMVIPLVLSSR
ncbi:MAG: putative hydrolase of the HAD superfamily [Candidatus Azotimanducaceae bacterium]|jgi:putative hydrolase of the HAD superfamily